MQILGGKTQPHFIIAHRCLTVLSARALDLWCQTSNVNDIEKRKQKRFDIEAQDRNTPNRFDVFFYRNRNVSIYIQKP